MERILIGDLHNHTGKEVSVSGWVDNRRDHGKLIFLDIRDRSGKVQAVALPNHDGVVEDADRLRSEWVISVTAKVNERPEKMVNKDEVNGDIELELLSIEVISEAEEIPFEKDTEVNLDTLFDNRPFTLRSERARHIFNVQHHLIQAYRDALSEKDFKEFESPKLVGDDAEGGANVFELEYFHGKKAYLATSPQLYKQIMVGVFERVYAIGNVFRAEKHSTTRHLNEYTSLDAEMGFIKDHTDVMAVLTHVMKTVRDRLETHCKDALTYFGVESLHIPETIPSMKLREAQVLIHKETGEDCREEKDLAPEHERWLSEYAKKEFNSDFIFITHFPIEKTAFYAYEDPEDKGYTKYFDLLFRGVELVSGGQRIHNPEQLQERLKVKGLDPKNFSFYLQAFKYGIPPHGGWGMGLERLTQKILGLENVKEATLFPRDMNRIDTLLSTNDNI